MTLHIPGSEDEVCSLVRDAAAQGTLVAVCGGDTKAGIGRPAQNQATLSTRALTGITLYEPAELVIGARAGTPLEEVEAALAEKGQRLAFEPPDYRALMGSTGTPISASRAGRSARSDRRLRAALRAAHANHQGHQGEHRPAGDLQSRADVCGGVRGWIVSRLSSSQPRRP